MRILRALTIILICIIFSQQTQAWGLLGHRIVGEIADTYLTKKAKKEIKNILGFETVAMSSNWPDFIKSDPAYNYLSNWHYANLPAGLSDEGVKSFLAADTTTDAFTKTAFIINELKINRLLTMENKQLYLRLLIHIIGDIHQPLHLGRPGDRGGNGIRVRWFSDSVNLHQVWDEKLISFQELSYTEYAAAINHPTEQQKAELMKRSMVDHMVDTYRLTEKIYRESIPNSRLDYKYNFVFIGLLNDQLLKGGLHLAAVLNDIYK